MSDTQTSKQRIVDAAVIVFNDNLSANLESVADRAGVTRRTLHRHFAGREELIAACAAEMNAVCQRAMKAAYQAGSDPVRQLELMLYAGIDCNHQYAFLTKLQYRTPDLPDAPIAAGVEYENIKDTWYALVGLLQEQELIDRQLTPAWLFFLFGGMIDTTITAYRSGDVAPNAIKQFAWRSFARSIGLRTLDADIPALSLPHE